MRNKRKSVVAGLAAVMVLSTAGTAMADGASDNISRVQAAFSPNAQTATTYGPGTLFAQVQTIGNANQAGLAAQAAERVYLDFDSNLKFDTAFAPKCSSTAKNAIATGSGVSTQAAITACGKNTIIGSGTAHGLIPVAPGPPPVTIDAKLTITAFNGPTSVAGAPCGSALTSQEGCDFLGGRPTILLHAYNEGLTYSSVTTGELITSPVAGMGKRLVVTNAPDVAADTGSIALFNSTIGKTSIQRKVIRRHGRRIVRRIRHYYVSARCSGDKDWDFQGSWVYDDDSTDTDTYSQKCGN